VPGTKNEEVVPPEPPALVRWLYKHGAELKAIRVGYEMLTEDSSQTVWHVEFVNGHKETVNESRELAELLNFYPSPGVPSWRAIASLKEPLREMCEVRAKWEKKHAGELADYRRLKAKFEGSAT
jgi:hypothetical protein